MIKSFKHKGLERFYTTGNTKGIQAEHADKLNLILTALNKAHAIENLNIPSFKLHLLHGNLKGLWAITVRANWRVTFEFDEITKDVYIVDYLDYHKK